LSAERFGARVATGGVDLQRHRRVHLIGIGGAGMSSIALVLAAMGHEVSGSDLKRPSALERLQASGISVRVGHDASAVEGADLVARSSAIGDGNVEWVAAERAGIERASRADLLAAITRQRRTIAVAGTHGKTTTSSMAALVLVRAGRDPSFVLGGELNEIGGSAAWGSGPWMVVEADESDGTFLELEREVAVVTNVEDDHLDHFGTLERLREDFAAFAGAARARVVSADDAMSRSIWGRSEGTVTFGTDPSADVRVASVITSRFASRVELVVDGSERLELQLATPGRHNALNAAAAIAAGRLAEVEPAEAVAALEHFAGVTRRFQLRGWLQGAAVVEDYAHHPTEVKAALSTARGAGFDRVVAVLQPHRYSRTAEHARGFALTLIEGADEAAVCEVYPAGETPIPGVSGLLINAEAAKVGRALAWLPGREDIVAWLTATLRPGDICVLLGAGDLPSVLEELAVEAEPGDGGGMGR